MKFMLVFCGALLPSLSHAQQLLPFSKALPPALNVSAGATPESTGDQFDQSTFWQFKDIQNLEGISPIINSLTTSMAVPTGDIVLSQLSDSQCSVGQPGTGEGKCPTRVYLIKPDHSRLLFEIDRQDGTPDQAEDHTVAMLPQIIPDDPSAKDKGLKGSPSISIDPNNATLIVSVGQPDKVSTQIFRLKPASAIIGRESEANPSATPQPTPDTGATQLGEVESTKPAKVAPPGLTLQDLVGAGLSALCAPFARIVTAAEGVWNSVNQFGCVGAFQFCPATFRQYFAGTVDEFIKDHSAQVGAWKKYEQTQWQLAVNNGLTTKLKGNPVSYRGQTATIDDSAILMACQFGCGKFGLLYNYAIGQNCDQSNVKDGNSLSVCSYLIKGANQIVSCFTGSAPPVTATLDSDISKGTPTANHANSSAATGTTCGEDFGSQGPLEISVGQYNLRFGSTATTDTLKRLLDLLKSAQ